MVKVSIVMPVYNCEEYLHESLNSVLHQTLQEWELLCVDDGSNDHSLDILKQYQFKDERIHVFSQPNQGAGIARNLGLEHAQGEYIGFLDADDYYMDKDALEQMYKACKIHDVDACGSIIKLLRNGVIADAPDFGEVKQAAREKQILEYRDFQFDYGYCGFIFKTSVIRKQGIHFPPYRRFEDPPFLVRTMLKVGKFCFLEKSLYCYRTPNVSMRFNVVKTVDLLKGLNDNLEFAASHKLDLLFKRTVRRIEVEYGNLICHNISAENIEILELLLKANHLVKSVYQKEKYVLLPLQKILGSVAEAERYHHAKLYKRMADCERIYLYGAGNATTDFLVYLKNKGFFEKVTAILVTSKEGNPEAIGGIPVIAVDEYQYIEKDLVLITVTSIYREEIIKKLQELQVEAYEPVDAGMLCV